MIYKGIFTVLFENPFWIGLYERIEGERYEVCKITFGTEPKDYEVYDYWLANCDKLQFSQPIKIEKGIGTKAQQALKAQHEQVKIERKTQSREEKEAEKERQFILKQEKKKAKHKGK